MAKRRNRYAFTGHRPANIESVEQSRFWLRLDDLSRDASSKARRDAINHLKSSVGKVTDRAGWISTQVSRFMPQYTLHEQHHFLNVLAIMDALVPDDVIDRFGPLDCVLPILAAYTHDLGMALSQNEHDRLQVESTEQGKHFASYRTVFDEELRQLERWKKRRDELTGKIDAKSQQEAAAARKRIDAIEGHILASYLRHTHTEDEQVRRLRGWLDAIKQETGDDNLFRYGVAGKDFQRTLALIAISHGRGALWLRRQLIDGGPDDRFFQPVATGESANLAFPSLLLRLADVMDFDASRAPRILFKHFGIDNDQSVLEWNKHLSIVGWRLDVDPDGKQQPDLLYSAECQHPVHEKAIREFKTWIDAELSAVRIELDAQRRQLPAAAQHRYDLHLPSQTRLDIRSARDPRTDRPKYVYHDLQFRLDQDEIQQLLMGESLYGDPGLCVRELLQNALDALELRELRLKMKQKGEVREPVDGELIRPGWVREPDGREEELRATLDCGTDEDTGQQWLRVTDNGVGMTEEVIKNYFTQIGKSYYRSPEFNQERAAMKAAGEIVSPISIFGIGILSCFMISDRINVRTNPGVNDSSTRGSVDLTISGPGSLFWFREGTLDRQGTEITLFIKPGIKVGRDDTGFEMCLRKHFDYGLGEYSPRYETAMFGIDSLQTVSSEILMQMLTIRHSIDPLLVAAMNAVWPQYGVVGPTNSGTADRRIDDSLHPQMLFPIHVDMVRKKAAEWSCSSEFLGTIKWRCCDWIDNEHPNGTGSRIRVWYPQTDEPDGECKSVTELGAHLFRCEQHELAAFVEPQLDPGSRLNILINGMRVADAMSIEPMLEFAPCVGSRIWVDLRGTAAPKLTADRQKLMAPPDSIRGVFDRFFNTLASWTPIPQAAFFEAFSVPPYIRNRMGLKGVTEVSLVDACMNSWNSVATVRHVELLSILLLQSYARMSELKCPIQALPFSPGRTPHLTDARQLNVDRRFDHVRVRDLAAKLLTRLNTRESKSIANTIQYEFEKTELRVVVGGNRVFPKSFADIFPLISVCIDGSILQEGFQPDLKSSWSRFNVFGLSGLIGDASLNAPGTAAFHLEDDEHTVQFLDPRGETPRELVQRGYDLTFPMTAVPLGQLRRECEKWRSDRWYRPLGVAPFLLPALHDMWPKHAELFQATFGVPHIYCLLPRFELWSKRFSDWTDDNWHDPENLSALWDLSGHFAGTPGQVLWARGTHDINEMPKIGLPAPEFLETHAR